MESPKYNPDNNITQAPKLPGHFEEFEGLSRQLDASMIDPSVQMARRMTDISALRTASRGV